MPVHDLVSSGRCLSDSISGHQNSVSTNNPQSTCSFLPRVVRTP